MSKTELKLKDKNAENMPIEYIKDIKNIFKDMKQNKIYYPYLNGLNFNYVRKLKKLAKKQLDLSNNYDIFNNTFNRKYWIYALDINNDNREILELYEHSKTKNPSLIIQNMKYYSNYNGNHGSYNAYYVKNDSLCRIFIKSLTAFSKKDHYYHKSGGNYSFSHDLVCDLSKIVNKKYDFFQYRDI